MLGWVCVGLSACLRLQAVVIGGWKRGRNQGHLQQRFNSRGNDVRYGEEQFFSYWGVDGEQDLYIWNYDCHGLRDGLGSVWE